MNNNILARRVTGAKAINPTAQSAFKDKKYSIQVQSVQPLMQQDKIVLRSNLFASKRTSTHSNFSRKSSSGNLVIPPKFQAQRPLATKPVDSSISKAPRKIIGMSHTTKNIHSMNKKMDFEKVTTVVRPKAEAKLKDSIHSQVMKADKAVSKQQSHPELVQSKKVAAVQQEPITKKISRITKTWGKGPVTQYAQHSQLLGSTSSSTIQLEASINQSMKKSDYVPTGKQTKGDRLKQPSLKISLPAQKDHTAPKNAVLSYQNSRNVQKSPPREGASKKVGGGLKSKVATKLVTSRRPVVKMELEAQRSHRANLNQTLRIPSLRKNQFSPLKPKGHQKILQESNDNFLSKLKSGDSIISKQKINSFVYQEGELSAGRKLDLTGSFKDSLIKPSLDDVPSAKVNIPGVRKRATIMLQNPKKRHGSQQSSLSRTNQSMKHNSKSLFALGLQAKKRPSNLKLEPATVSPSRRLLGQKATKDVIKAHAYHQKIVASSERDEPLSKVGSPSSIKKLNLSVLKSISPRATLSLDLTAEAQLDAKKKQLKAKLFQGNSGQRPSRQIELTPRTSVDKAVTRSNQTNQSINRNSRTKNGIKVSSSKSGRKSGREVSNSTDRGLASKKSRSTSKHTSMDLKKKLQQHNFDANFQDMLNWKRLELNQAKIDAKLRDIDRNQTPKIEQKLSPPVQPLGQMIQPIRFEEKLGKSELRQKKNAVEDEYSTSNDEFCNMDEISQPSNINSPTNNGPSGSKLMDFMTNVFNSSAPPEPLGGRGSLKSYNTIGKLPKIFANLTKPKQMSRDQQSLTPKKKQENKLIPRLPLLTSKQKQTAMPLSARLQQDEDQEGQTPEVLAPCASKGTQDLELAAQYRTEEGNKSNLLMMRHQKRKRVNTIFFDSKQIEKMKLKSERDLNSKLEVGPAQKGSLTDRSKEKGLTPQFNMMSPGKLKTIREAGKPKREEVAPDRTPEKISFSKIQSSRCSSRDEELPKKQGKHVHFVFEETQENEESQSGLTTEGNITMSHVSASEREHQAAQKQLQVLMAQRRKPWREIKKQKEKLRQLDIKSASDRKAAFAIAEQFIINQEQEKLLRQRMEEEEP